MAMIRITNYIPYYLRLFVKKKTISCGVKYKCSPGLKDQNFYKLNSIKQSFAVMSWLYKCEIFKALWRLTVEDWLESVMAMFQPYNGGG